MSTPDETPRAPARAEAPPPLGLVLRYYGPWLAGIGLVVILVGAYLNLSGRISALEARLGGSDAASGPQPAPRGTITTGDLTPPPAGADGGLPTVVTRSPAPRWECTGEIAPDLVRQSIGRHGSAVIRCFEQRRQVVPGLQGTLILRLRVAANGAVDSVHVAGIDDDELVSCVGNDALHWRFPPPVNGSCAVVEAPFALGR
jgi:hypothetical protein